MHKISGLLLFLAGLSPVWSEALPFVAPRSVASLGLTYSQPAYFVESTLPWIDIRALREDFIDLQDWDDEEIEQLVRFGTPLVTERQLALRGLLITPFKTLRKKPILVYQPPSYFRSGYVPLLGPAGRPVALIDVKPLGRSPEGEEELTLLLAINAHVSGGRRLSRQQWARCKYQAGRYEKALAVREEESGLDEETLRANAHRTKQFLLRRDLFKMGEDSYRLRKPSARKEEFLSIARRCDYLNAAYSLERGVKEIIVQRAYERKFHEYYLAGGYRIPVHRTYFLQAPKWSIISPEGRPIAGGMIGRRPNWRFGLTRNVQLPEFLGMFGVLKGGIQFDALGGMIDFELPELRDPRVVEDLGWEPGRGQRVEKLAREAVQKYLRGDSAAISDLIHFFDEKMAVPLPAAPLPEVPELKQLARENIKISEIDLNLGSSHPKRNPIPGLRNFFWALDTEGVTGALLLNHLHDRPGWIVEFLDDVASNAYRNLSKEQVSVLTSLLFALYRIDAAVASGAARLLAATFPRDLDLIYQELTYEAVRVEARELGVPYENFTFGSKLHRATARYFAATMLNYLRRNEYCSPAPQAAYLSLADPQRKLLRERVLRRWKGEPVRRAPFECPADLRSLGRDMWRWLRRSSAGS